MEFIITTSKEVAEAVQKQLEWDEKMQSGRSIEFGGLRHDAGFSTVRVKAKKDGLINPVDIFWLGLFCNNWKK